MSSFITPAFRLCYNDSGSNKGKMKEYFKKRGIMKKTGMFILCLALLWGCGKPKPPTSSPTIEYKLLGGYLFEGETISLFIGDQFQLLVKNNTDDVMIMLGDRRVATVNYSESEQDTIVTIVPVKAGDTAITIKSGDKSESFEVSIYEMELYSLGIEDGILADDYGKFGSQKSKGIPTLSLPINIGNAPLSTACFAISMIDPDAGNFVHWTATNFGPMDLIEDASLEMAERMIQGRNDFGTIGYGGPTPPGKTHNYLITVYALREPLALQPGFSYKQFKQAVTEATITSEQISGKYRGK